MIKIYNDGRRMTAALCGDIDHHAARELRMELDEHIRFSRPEQLILDFGGVGFMDSSGIGLIMGRVNAMRAVGGTVLIKNAKSDIAQVIRLSGLEGLLIKGVNV